MKDSVH